MTSVLMPTDTSAYENENVWDGGCFSYNSYNLENIKATLYQRSINSAYHNHYEEAKLLPQTLKRYNTYT